MGIQAIRELHKKKIKEDEDFVNNILNKVEITIPECLTLGTYKDYYRWFRFFINCGGIPTHFYDYPLAQSHLTNKIFIAENYLPAFALYGSHSVIIIIKKDCIVENGDFGHNNLFYYDNILKNASSWIPSYDDFY